MKKTLGILSALAISGVARAEVNVSGYVDGGYDWTNKSYPAPMTNVNAFSFHEGGVWFSGNTGATSYMLGLDARSYPALALQDGTVVSGGVGVSVSQGYVAHKFDNGFNWTLGRFDGLLGHESNYSVNNPFVHTGLLFAFVPSYNTGLLLGYDLSDALKVQLLVANGANNLDVGGREFGHPGIGFKVSSKMDGLTAYVGGHFDSNHPTAAGTNKSYVIDIGADTAVSGVDLGAELLLNKAAVPNAQSGLGFGIHAGTAVAQGTKVNADFEWDNGKIGGGDTKTTELRFRVGPSFALSEALSFKADYTLNKRSGDGAPGAKAGHGIALAGIYKF